jgi:hypothetical protein
LALCSARATEERTKGHEPRSSLAGALELTEKLREEMNHAGRRTSRGRTAYMYSCGENKSREHTLGDQEHRPLHTLVRIGPACVFAREESNEPSGKPQGLGEK